MVILILAHFQVTQTFEYVCVSIYTTLFAIFVMCIARLRQVSFNKEVHVNVADSHIK